MIITQEYNIGDLVFFLYDNKIYTGTIYEVFRQIELARLDSSSNSWCNKPRFTSSIGYRIVITDSDRILARFSEEVAKTKEELIKGL